MSSRTLIQAHFPLEIDPHFRLILHWKRLRVVLDRDLAILYNIETKNLNKAVKRNIMRFPEDFCFQLTADEVRNLRFQIGTTNISSMSRSLPFVFTEYGALMVSSILNSENAVKISLLIIKAFSKLKQLIASHEELRRLMTELEGRQNKTEEDVQMLITAVNMLLDPPFEESKKRIGFF